MNLYVEQKNKYQRKINEFLHRNAFFAFNEQQYKNGLKRLKTTESDLQPIPGNGYILKGQAPKLYGLVNEMREARTEAINDPETGLQFARDMFLYELRNHEYLYTADPEEAVNALGYSMNEIKKNAKLKCALQEAINILIEEE